MLLAIDVGNTNIVLGVFEGERLIESWRLATLRERTSDEIGIWVAQLFEHRAIDANKVTGIVMGSVVPPLTSTFMTMAQRYFGMRPLNVDSSVDTGMPILYKNPAEVGADRILNGVAAYRLYGRERRAPMIVVDFGRRRRSMRSRRRGSISAASSRPACRFRPMRSFSAPRGCRASI